MKKSSVNIQLRSLKAAMNTAVRLELIDRNPFEKTRLLKVPAEEPVYLSPEEFVRLVAAIDDEGFKSFVLVAVLTGMRRGELINLQWNDVDFTKRIIRVTNKPDFVVKGMRPRVLPMNRDLFNILSSLPRRGEYVLSNHRRQKHTPGFVTKKFKESVRAAVLPDGIHLHSLRHTHASWLLQASTPLAEIQRLLGHSSIVTTQIYSHMEQEHLRGAVEKLRLPEFTPVQNVE
jgi:integrase